MTTARVRVAEVLAFVGLVAALVGALGPAEQVRSAYSWPPRSLPEGTPSSLWYTPLVLIRHRPETISAELPCNLPRALPTAKRPLTVLATARSPEERKGLAVTGEEGQLIVTIGDERLSRVPLHVVPAVRGECEYRLWLGSGHWSLEGGPRQVTLGGSLREMPFVSGLFSELDLRSPNAPAISVTTAVHGSRTILRQTLAWLLATLSIVAALLLVALERRPHPWKSIRRAARQARSSAQPADALVGLALLAWWVLAPAFWDDGWIAAKQGVFEGSRGFSTYYISFGANAPLGYWLDWAQHWLIQSTSTLLIQRLPALLCLVVAWLLCRWIFSRVLSSADGEGRVALWALASAFLVSALAWGMTLRPEPQVALLATGVMACAVRFHERRNTGALALAAVLVPFALMTHPAGLVSLAPLLVLARDLYPWVRTRIAVAATIFISSLALLAVLAVVGADLEQRRADARLIAAHDEAQKLDSSELSRYAALTELPPLRRASVALMALALLAFLLRRQRDRQPLLDLPALSVAIALILLSLTPSKLPWHFGALLGFVSVTVASETVRLRLEAARSRAWRMWPFFALGATTVAIAWSWSPRNRWNALDLRTLAWTPGFERWIAVSTLAIALPVIILAAQVVIAYARGQGARVPQIGWRLAASSAPLLAVPLLVFTVCMLAADAAKTDSWTLTRQNLGTLRRDAGCGLADDLIVPISSSARPLEAEVDDRRSVPTWMPPAPVEGLTRFALGPIGKGSARTPWFRLPGERRIGFYVSGEPTPADRLWLEWGYLRGGKLEVIERSEISTGFASEPGSMPWRFVANGELPAQEVHAHAARITLRSSAAPGTAIAVTAPVTYSTESLFQRFNGRGSASLVLPSLATYFPCARRPQHRNGIVEAPGQIVVPWDSVSPLHYAKTSPFAGVLDLYVPERLPTADSTNPPQDFVVLGVDLEIPGAKRAPPLVASFDSKSDGPG